MGQISPNLPTVGGDSGQWAGKLNAALQAMLTQGNASDATLAAIEETIRDVIGAALVQGSGIGIAVNDANNTITISYVGGSGGTYSDEQAQDAVAALLGAGSHSGITFTYDDANNRLSATVTGGGSGGSSGPNDSLVWNAAAHGVTPGSADIGPVLNSLIDTVNQAGGGTIVLPPGNYTVGTTIAMKGGVTLTSLAGNHGYIAASPSRQGVKLSAAAGLTTPMIDTPQGGWSINVQGIDVSGNGNCVGIRFRGVYWGSIKQSMANACTIGFQQTTAADGGSAGFACVFEDLMTTNCVSSSVTAVTGAADIDGTDHYFARCEFAARATGGTLTSSNKYVAAFVLRGSNHFVSDCVFETSDRGAVIYATKTRVTGCRADTNNGDGWWVIGGSNTFTGCDAVGNSQNGSNLHDDWIIDNAAWGADFVNCHSRLAGSIRPRYGFRDERTIRAPQYSGVYVGCTVEDAGTQKWQFPNGQVAGVSFPPTTLKPDAGTTTIDASQTSGVIDLSNYGSGATISGLSGGVDGQTVRLLGNPNVTVSHGTSIKNTSGANVTLAANRLYPYTCFGGVWYGA